MPLCFSGGEEEGITLDFGGISYKFVPKSWEWSNSGVCCHTDQPPHEVVQVGKLRPSMG